ncbi:hypothetical protein R3P38DRAFT_3007768 [Favolaschia claudopus]|uniref:Uncharacterized protein n=1 Tax=Favolaschia claudopus TaxID=2862362 RepID=A0AAW0AJD3_9AGAR
MLLSQLLRDPAIFSGYSMSWPDFQQLAMALSPPLAHYAALEPQPDEEYVSEFDVWRLRLPAELRDETPIPKVIYAPNWKYAEGMGRNRIFFDTRCVDAGEDSSIEDHPGMTAETDLDRNRRDKMIELIQERAKFSTIKDFVRCQLHIHALC